MRQLHVVGVSDDGATLLLGTAENAAKATHGIALDGRLRAAVRGQIGPPGGDRVESALSPKEIQARLRAGATPEQVAKAAGVPVARVIPYAAPVEAERTRIVDDARAAIMHRHRGPDSSKPLGEIVDARLREVPGLKSESVDWTARRRHDGAWIVELSYAARGGRRSATWLWRPAERDLTSLDIAASRLAADGAPARATTRRRPAAERPKPAAKRAGKPRSRTASKATAKTTVRKAAAKKAAPKPAVKATSRSTTARKAAPTRVAAAASRTTKKAAPTKAAAKKATTKKVAATRVAAKPAPARTAAKPAPARTAAKATPKRTARKPAVVARTAKPPVKRTRRAAARRPEVTAPPALRVVEPIDEPAVEVVQQRPAEQAEHPAAAAAQATPRRRGAHVPLPSWSEVLLGVQGPPRDGSSERDR